MKSIEQPLLNLNPLGWQLRSLRHHNGQDTILQFSCNPILVNQTREAESPLEGPNCPLADPVSDFFLVLLRLRLCLLLVVAHNGRRGSGNGRLSIIFVDIVFDGWSWRSLWSWMLLVMLFLSRCDLLGSGRGSWSSGGSSLFDLAFDQQSLMISELDVHSPFIVQPWQFSFKDIGILRLNDIEVWSEGSSMRMSLVM